MVYMQQQSTYDGLMSPPTINTFVYQTACSLHRLVAMSDISEQWTVHGDLFTFVRDLSSTAVVNARCGPTLLEQCPTFMASFWEFDANVHWFHIGVPRILRRDAYRARDTCLGAIKEWKSRANLRSRCNAHAHEMLWDEIWGMKMMRDRQEMYAQLPEFDMEARAGADLGIVWA